MLSIYQVTFENPQFFGYKYFANFRSTHPLIELNMNALVVLSCLALAGYANAQAGCWETGCQADTWAVVGCGQYSMVETSRRGCPGGKIYNCCPGGSPPAQPQPGPGDDACKFNIFQKLTNVSMFNKCKIS